MCIACEWAEQASLMEKWRESRALRALKDEPEPEEGPEPPNTHDEALDE